MSASREKKKRQIQPENPVSEVTKKGMSKGLKRALTTVVAIVLVAAVVFLGMVSTSFFQKHTTGAVASGHKLSPAMINFFYSDSYGQLSSYMSGAFDTTVPLSEQEYTGEEFDTWADYLLDYAVSTAADTYAIYDEAVANGYELSEEDQASIQNQIAMLSAYSSMYGYTAADSFVTAQYGPGCTTKLYEEYLTVNTMASGYAMSVNDALTYSQEEVDAYYAENAQDFDSVTYRSFPVSAEIFPEGTEAADIEEAAKAMSEASVGNEQEFLNQAMALTPADVAETYDAATATMNEDVTLSTCSETTREWLADSARQSGDTTYISNGAGGYDVLYFIRNEDYSFQLPNVRHILISFTDAESEEAKAEDGEKAQSILDEYLAGDQTEEAFAELAKKYSNDNAEDGGLYENVVPGYMVEAFEDWCYDETRQPGDTGIVESTYGYHVMYFCGSGDVYLDYLVEETLHLNDYNTWTEEVTADATYTINDSAKRLVADR